MTKIISIANQKGGVGKTTTAINLASSLAVSEKKTLLIDIDPQSNATSGIGLDYNKITKSIYNVLIENEGLENVTMKTHLEYLDIIPSNQDLIGAEIELVNMETRESKLKNALLKINDVYNYIIIDCPPSLGLLTINALTCSHSLVIPVQCEYYALEGLSRLFSTIEIIRGELNPDLSIDGVLLTMFDSRNNLSHQVANDIKINLSSTVFKTIIPRNVKLSEAPSFGKPIVLYDIDSKGAVSYLKLAKELLAKDKNKARERSTIT